MKLLDTAKLEKMMLAKRIGRFLMADHPDGEREAVEEVARVLAKDVSDQVREVLAFELRKCIELPDDLAETLAKDVENVAAPFLATTQCFTDAHLAALIPVLREYARASLARRTDLGSLVTEALAKSGQEHSVSLLIRNDNLDIGEVACDNVVRRFGDNQRLMDQLAGRVDLPIEVVEQLVEKVSDFCRDTLLKQYVMDAVTPNVAGSGQSGGDTQFDAYYEKTSGASPQQVHAMVTELRERKQLTMLLVVEMAERGCLPFLESAVALAAGLPLARVREIFGLSNMSDFVRLMQMAEVSKTMAPRILSLVKKNYSATPKKPKPKKHAALG